MSSSVDIVQILDLLKELLFYSKVLCISSCFTAGILLVKLMIHTKNQRDLI